MNLLWHGWAHPESQLRQGRAAGVGKTRAVFGWGQGEVTNPTLAPARTVQPQRSDAWATAAGVDRPHAWHGLWHGSRPCVYPCFGVAISSCAEVGESGKCWVVLREGEGGGRPAGDSVGQRCDGSAKCSSCSAVSLSCKQGSAKFAHTENLFFCSFSIKHSTTL